MVLFAVLDVGVDNKSTWMECLVSPYMDFVRFEAVFCEGNVVHAIGRVDGRLFD